MKFSVITTTYNSEKTILKTIRSLKSQKYQNIEYIWIDNSSTDSTYKILLNNRCSKTKLFKVEKHSISEAWNFGIEQSSGDIIYFLNSDDQLYNDKILGEISWCFKNFKSNIVFGDICYINKSNKVVRNWTSKILPKKIYTSLHFKRKIYYGWMPPHPGFFILKNYIKKIGHFNSNYRISFDYDLMIKALKHDKAKIIYLDNYVSKMLIGGNSNKIINLFRKMKEDYKIIRHNRIGNIFTLLFKNIQKITQFF